MGARDLRESVRRISSPRCSSGWRRAACRRSARGSTDVVLRPESLADRRRRGGRARGRRRSDDGVLDDAARRARSSRSSRRLPSAARAWRRLRRTRRHRSSTASREALRRAPSRRARRGSSSSRTSRGTIDYLAERLDGLRVDGRPLRVLKLYGPMSSRAARRAPSASFRDEHGPVVLLSSEVGSEGLDFQFCSRMFNYDLPWNPMRVEQRIGRLDRYGQTSELIQILNMVVADTIEERIFYRLYERIGIFESSIGDLEAILGEVEVDLAALQRDALSGALTEAELERRRNLIADVILRRQQDNEEFEQREPAVPLQRRRLPRAVQRHRASRALRHARRAAAARRALPRRVRVPRDDSSRVGRRSGVFRLTGAIAPFRALLARALARSGGGARRLARFLAPAARRGHRRDVRPGDRDGAAAARVHLAASPDRARAGDERRPARRAVVLRRARARRSTCTSEARTASSSSSCRRTG